MARTRETDAVVLSALRARKITLWLGGAGLLCIGLAILWLCRLPFHPPDGSISADQVELLSAGDDSTISWWTEEANRALKKPLTAMTSVKMHKLGASLSLGNVSVTDTCKPVSEWRTFSVSLSARVTDTHGAREDRPFTDTLCEILWVPAFSDIRDLAFDTPPDNPAGPAW